MLLILLLYGCTLLIPPSYMVAWVTVWQGHTIHWSHLFYFSTIILSLAITLLSGARIKIDEEWPLIFLTMAWLVSCFFGMDYKYSLQSTLSLLLKGPVVGWVILKNSDDIQQASSVICWLYLGIISVAAIGLFGLLLGRSPIPLEVGGRMVGTIGHALPLATLLVYALPISMVFPSIHPYRRLALTSLLVVSLLLTVSRSSWIIACFILTIFLKYEPNLKVSMKKLWVVAAFSACVIFVVLLNRNRAFLSEYRASAIERLNLKSSNFPVALDNAFWDGAFHIHRVVSYRIVRNMIKIYTVFGSGLGTFPLRYEKYWTPNDPARLQTPDNMVLRLLSETGIVGTITWILFLYTWYKKSLDILNQAPMEEQLLRKALIMSTTGVLLNSLFFDSLYWNAIIMTLAIGMPLAASRWKKSNF